MVDIFAKRIEEFNRYQMEIRGVSLQDARDMDLYPFFIPFSDTEGTTAVWNGHEVIMLGSNNYLGLTTHPKVKEAAKKAIDEYGTSCTGSRFLNGTLDLHLELDRRLAKFIGMEAAICFTTGYQSNLGAISAIIQKGDYAILDREDHASIVDGVTMSRGRMQRFNHNEPESLDKALSSLPEDAGKLVIVDGVYSMAGDIAPLPEIVPICKKYGARLMVDDAHSLGVLADGHGTAAYFDMIDDVDLVMGTFSKSFAAIGGVIAGNKDIIEYIQHSARSLIFSAALPASLIATVLAVLDIIEEDPSYSHRVLENAAYVRENLAALGFDIGQSTTPVVPIYIRDQARTVLFWKALADEGVYTNPVLPPGVAPNESLLRTSYTATHTRDHLDRALEIFERVGKRMDIIPE